MDSPVVSSRVDVVAAPTQPRPTPPPAGASFAQVLRASAQGIVQGADQAASSLPGAPLMALALRGATAPMTAAPLASATSLPITSMTASVPGLASAAGSSVSTTSTAAEGPTTSAGTSASATTGDPSLDGAMAQSQEMNLYYLQIQEQVNAQDRAYSAYSNVLKSQHDTVMTSVGNIR